MLPHLIYTYKQLQQMHSKARRDTGWHAHMHILQHAFENNGVGIWGMGAKKIPSFESPCDKNLNKCQPIT
jgi:hypothetical protein